MFMDDAEVALPSIKSNAPLTIALVICVAGLLLVGFYSPIFNYISSFSYGM